MQRSVLFTSSLVLAAVFAGACGDDSGGSGGAGGSTSATTTSTSTTTGATTSSSTSTATSGPGAGGAGGAGDTSASSTGGATGSGGQGGQGGSACAPDADFPVLDAPPASLSETGLYTSIADGTIDPRVRPYAPQFPLWSDGLDKARWVYLPACASIDTTDLDHWQLPVGTRLYKEFRSGGALVETRVMHRFGPANTDWWFAAYQWSADGSDATFVPDGVIDANGTDHDIPSVSTCTQCHGFLPEKSLGFSAIQLAHAGGAGEVTLDVLVAEGRLTMAPAFDVVVPGEDALEVRALGYLHANCGHCHNENGVFIGDPFDLRLSVLDATRDDTGAFRTAVGVPTTNFSTGGVTHRINPGDPATSCVNYRMGVRPGMPPVGTEHVDDDGKADMDAWVTALP